jgi:hypothetical protein
MLEAKARELGVDRLRLAPTLRLGQSRIILKAVGLAVDRLLDRALRGFIIRFALIFGPGTGQVAVRIRSDNGRGAKTEQKSAR